MISYNQPLLGLFQPRRFIFYGPCSGGLDFRHDDVG